MDEEEKVLTVGELMEKLKGIDEAMPVGVSVFNWSGDDDDDGELEYRPISSWDVNIMTSVDDGTKMLQIDVPA